MNSTQALHKLGQSLWLDNITRTLVADGTLQSYIDNLAVTGLTSNPSIYEKAIKSSDSYDADIHEKGQLDLSTEDLFFDLAVDDLVRAADIFKPVFDATEGLDGWVSLEVSPLLAEDSAGTIAAAKHLHKRAQRANLFIKIPGTPAGLVAIEESIYAGIAVNVTLLFSPAQYSAAAAAYMRGIKRRIADGLNPKVGSVASIFISRWDVAVKDAVVPTLQNKLGIAIAQRTYKAYCDLLSSPDWQQLLSAGAQPQRLLWASTGSKDESMPEDYYVTALAAPNTINTLPEKTLLAFAESAEISDVMAEDGADAEQVFAEFVQQGVDIEGLAAQLQKEGAQAFSKSWKNLLQVISDKRQAE